MAAMPAQDVERMFAKTLVLAGFVTALAWIPTAAADHTGSCEALNGHEDLLVLYEVQLYVQCLPTNSALPAPAIPKPTPALPVAVPQVDNAGCHAAEGFEALCFTYTTALGLTGPQARPAPQLPALVLQDAGCHAAEGFEALCVAYNLALQGAQPRSAELGLGVHPDCIAVYPWSQLCALPAL